MSGYLLKWKNVESNTIITVGVYNKKYMLEYYLKLLHNNTNICELKFIKQYKNGKQVDITAKINRFIYN